MAGIPEWVEPGKCGWLVPAGSIEALTEAMGTALQLPVAQLEQLGQTGRERVAIYHNVARKELFRAAS